MPTTPAKSTASATCIRTGKNCCLTNIQKPKHQPTQCLIWTNPCGHAILASSPLPHTWYQTRCASPLVHLHSHKHVNHVTDQIYTFHDSNWTSLFAREIVADVNAFNGNLDKIGLGLDSQYRSVRDLLASSSCTFRSGDQWLTRPQRPHVFVVVIVFCPPRFCFSLYILPRYTHACTGPCECTQAHPDDGWAGRSFPAYTTTWNPRNRYMVRNKYGPGTTQMLCIIYFEY